MSEPAMNVTKRQLGVNYLAGTGLVLTAVLVIQGVTLLRHGGQGLGFLTGVVPAVSLVSARFWLAESRLGDDQIWRIATWGGLGIAGLTLASTAIVLVHQLVTPVMNSLVTLLVANVGAGGVAGVLVGWSREHARRTRELSEKNAVMTRVLRHDIRNAAGVILGSVDVLTAQEPGLADEVSPIRSKAEELIELGEAARHVAHTRDPADTAEPVDLIPILRRRVDRIADAYPDAEIEARCPEAAWIRGDELVGVVVRELLENAVEHPGDTPRVTIDVEGTALRDQHTLVVTDDGPGIPDRERRLLSDGEEAQLQHSLGTGLWLVKWLVQRYGGSLAIEKPAEGGTRVEVRLPRADPGSGTGDRHRRDAPEPAAG